MQQHQKRKKTAEGYQTGSITVARSFLMLASGLLSASFPHQGAVERFKKKKKKVTYS